MDGISKTTFSPSSINNGAMKSLGVSIVSATILLMEALLRNIRFRFCKYISLNLKFKIKSHFFFFHFVSISNLLGSGKPATIHLLCFQGMVDNYIQTSLLAAGSSKYFLFCRLFLIQIMYPGHALN